MLRLSHAFSAIVLSGAALSAWAQPPGVPPVQLPAGAGKEQVEAVCVACHQTNLIVGSTGYSQDGWRYLTGKMIALAPPMADSITQYLAANFPPKNDRAPTLVPGDAKITFKEWIAADAGSAPARSAADGRRHHLVGRHVRESHRPLNPATGEMRNTSSQPDGAPAQHHQRSRPATSGTRATATARSACSIPRPARSTCYKMPDPDARDPHTPIFDREGTLWFTLQNSNMVGRLEPATGEIKLVTMPTARARRTA